MCWPLNYDCCEPIDFFSLNAYKYKGEFIWLATKGRHTLFRITINSKNFDLHYHRVSKSSKSCSVIGNKIYYKTSQWTCKTAFDNLFLNLNSLISVETLLHFAGFRLVMKCFYFDLSEINNNYNCGLYCSVWCFVI